jgi:hypothetical protein
MEGPRDMFPQPEIANKLSGVWDVILGLVFWIVLEGK